MTRWLVMILAVATTAGCSSFSFQNPFAKKAPDPIELPREQWGKLLNENAQRLHGEGIPPKDGTTTQPAPTGQVDEFLGFVKFVFYEFPKQTINFYLGNTPGKYARMMEDDQSADNRRSGILHLASDYPFARTGDYTRRYWQIAQGDPDVLVRLAAVRALNRSRDKSVSPIALKYLEDPNPLVRLEAAKALSNVPDEKAVPALLRHMNGQIELRAEGGRLEAQMENRDVRVACADALRNFPTRDVANAMVELLKDKQFELPWQARKSLILMTGHDYKYDQAKWKDYLSKADKPFG